MLNNAYPEEKETVIEVCNVKKNFKSYKDKATSFKEHFVTPARAKHCDVMVLKGISFKVHKGEAVGIIGKNGCGKSTVLKLLTRILSPNEGAINIKGRVSSLIELGAGFHPDMTGRENIYTNASIFGITRKEVDKRLSTIIRFSELEEFIDNPVRTYSSGMYMRLAFSVAINVDADVLLIDEILAVGDSAFQKKCFEKLKKIKARGTTIVIVSHSMEQLYNICDRLIWIEDGLIRAAGIPRFIGEQYTTSMEDRRLGRIELENQQRKDELKANILLEQEKTSQNSKQKPSEKTEELSQLYNELAYHETLKEICRYYQPGARRNGTGSVKYTTVALKNNQGIEVNTILTNQTYSLELQYKADKVYENIRFSIGITREDGIYCYGSCIEKDIAIPPEGKIRFEFSNALLQGKYMLDLWIETLDNLSLDSIFSLMTITVINDSKDEHGVLTMPHNWTWEPV